MTDRIRNLSHEPKKPPAYWVGMVLGGILAAAGVLVALALAKIAITWALGVLF